MVNIIISFTITGLFIALWVYAYRNNSIIRSLTQLLFKVFGVLLSWLPAYLTSVVRLSNKVRNFTALNMESAITDGVDDMVNGGYEYRRLYRRALRARDEYEKARARAERTGKEQDYMKAEYYYQQFIKHRDRFERRVSGKRWF